MSQVQKVSPGQFGGVLERAVFLPIIWEMKTQGHPDMASSPDQDMNGSGIPLVESSNPFRPPKGLPKIGYPSSP